MDMAKLEEALHIQFGARLEPWKERAGDIAAFATLTILVDSFTIY